MHQSDVYNTYLSHVQYLSPKKIGCSMRFIVPPEHCLAGAVLDLR